VRFAQVDVKFTAANRLKLALRLGRDQPQDHIAVAFAWAAESAQLVDDVRLEPDEALNGLTDC
jgi:hypothetical protein